MITILLSFKVWGLVLIKDDQYLITGCNDNELRIWQISFTEGEAVDFDVNLHDLTLADDAEISNVVYSLLI